ncbi:MAG: hypothetical protein Q9170_002422 [Blastenia crenularia]
MTAAVPPNQTSHVRKRKRCATEDEHSTLAEISPQPPWKRARIPFESRREANTAYWNSLSKLWLTRRALKELDRRNRQAADPSDLRALNRCEQLPGSIKDLSQLQRFARHGGPDLRDLRGYPERAATNTTAHAMPPSRSTARSKSKTTNTGGESTVKTSHRKSSAYHEDFEQHLIDHGVHPHNRAHKPYNYAEILERMAWPRPSLSPSRFSERDFDTFQQANEEALTEAMVMNKPFSIISGNAEITSAADLPFGNLDPLTDGTLVDAKPDFYDGVPPSQIDRRIREELGSYIMPSTQHHAPALPTFFSEGKGPKGSAVVAKRQACYDGVMATRGIDKLRAYRVDNDEAVHDGNAHTITSTYNSSTGTLQLYTVHSTKQANSESPPKYYMTQLDSYAMTGRADRFREGASAFRNARDWAKDKRDELITIANGKVKDASNGPLIVDPAGDSMQPQSMNGLVAVESETSEDGLVKDPTKASGLSNQRAKRGPTKKRSTLGPKRRTRKSDFGPSGRSSSSHRRSRNGQR